MIRLLNVKEDILVTLAVVSDFSYAWQLLDGYVDAIQALIHRDPRAVIRLRSLFVKTASVMDLPLLRINQAQSPDLVSVSQFYSGTSPRMIVYN